MGIGHMEEFVHVTVDEGMVLQCIDSGELGDGKVDTGYSWGSALAVDFVT